MAAFKPFVVVGMGVSTLRDYFYFLMFLLDEL